MSDMKKTTNELVEFQIKVKDLLDEAGSDVINALFQSEVGSSGEICSYYDGAEEFNNTVASTKLKIEHQDNHGGEGEGEDYWSVYKFTNGTDTAYVKFQGWYASYSGVEFNEWLFVEPKQKLITVYE